MPEWKVTHADFIKKNINLPENIEINHNTIVLTSQPAVQCWMEIARRLGLNFSDYKIFCLEFATKTLAEQNGLNIAGAAPNASALADIILKDRSIKAVTFICGNKRRPELPEKLKKNGVDVLETEAYETKFTPIKVDQPCDAVLFFSPSGVESFLSLNAVAPICFCIGNTTAAYAKQSGFKKILTSESSSTESLLKTLISYYSTSIVHAEK
jgi:uroporphyrinogen-III synthase